LGQVTFLCGQLAVFWAGLLLGFAAGARPGKALKKASSAVYDLASGQHALETMPGGRTGGSAPLHPRF